MPFPGALLPLAARRTHVAASAALSRVTLTRLSPPTTRTISILIKPGPARLWPESRRLREGEDARTNGSEREGGGGEGGGSAQTRTRTRAHTDTHSGDAHPRVHTQRQLAFLPGFLPVCSAPDRPLAAGRGGPHRAEAGPGRAGGADIGGRGRRQRLMPGLSLRGAGIVTRLGPQRRAM